MTQVSVAAQPCTALGAVQHCFEKYPAREAELGALKIQRALPIRERRLVGPWCFLDRYGPHSFNDSKPMDVATHPHMGLQTVTWLLAGEIVHNDSLGNEALLRPGGVNIMTSGDAIAHAEETPPQNSGTLSGVQLWVALPDAHRKGTAAFQHVGEVASAEQAGGIVTPFAGEVMGARSAAKHFSPIVGADLTVHARSHLEVPLDPSFEHALLLLAGDASLSEGSIELGSLYYLGMARSSIDLSSREGARLLLIGGPPFRETILMWWNFVARTPEEIAKARADWQAHERFGDVKAYRGPRLDAPPLVRLARPNPAS